MLEYSGPVAANANDQYEIGDRNECCWTRVFYFKSKNK